MSLPEHGVGFLKSLTDAGYIQLGLKDTSLSVDDLVWAAGKQGVMGLLWNDAKELAMEPFESISRKAGPIVLQQTATALAHRELLLQFLPKCAERGIPLILLKGVVFSEYLYSDWSLRRMGDVDFLIHYSDLTAVCEVMAQVGMAEVESCEHHTKWVMTSESNALTLECHWSIGPDGARLPIKPWHAWESDIWESAVPKTFAGSEVLVLCPEHFLIHLCLHWHFHKYRSKLRDMHDIYIAASHGSSSLDWSSVAMHSRRWNADTIVYLALREMTRYFRVSEELQDRVACLQPRNPLHRHAILPLLQRRIDDEAIAACPDEPRPRTSSWRGPRLTGVDHMVLSVCSGQLRELRPWLLPSVEHLQERFGLPSEPTLKHYLRYYCHLIGVFIRCFRCSTTKDKR